jgi:hypothetical protein
MDLRLAVRRHRVAPYPGIGIGIRLQLKGAGSRTLIAQPQVQVSPTGRVLDLKLWQRWRRPGVALQAAAEMPVKTVRPEQP